MNCSLEKSVWSTPKISATSLIFTSLVTRFMAPGSVTPVMMQPSCW